MDDLNVRWRLDQLNHLVGVWDTSIILLDTDGRETGTTRAVDSYRWAPSGRFLIHDVDATFNGERRQSMEIFALSPHGTGYHTRSYEADGSVCDYMAAVDGRLLTINGDDLRFVGTFRDDGQQLSGQWDQRHDLDWSPMMLVYLNRRPDQVETAP